jgi:hypothetical protein
VTGENAERPVQSLWPLIRWGWFRWLPPLRCLGFTACGEFPCLLRAGLTRVVGEPVRHFNSIVFSVAVSLGVRAKP